MTDTLSEKAHALIARPVLASLTTWAVVVWLPS